MRGTQAKFCGRWLQTPLRQLIGATAVPEIATSLNRKSPKYWVENAGHRPHGPPAPLDTSKDRRTKRALTCGGVAEHP